MNKDKLIAACNHKFARAHYVIARKRTFNGNTFIFADCLISIKDCKLCPGKAIANYKILKQHKHLSKKEIEMINENEFIEIKKLSKQEFENLIN